MLNTFESRMTRVDNYSPHGNKLVLIGREADGHYSDGPEIHTTTCNTVRFATSEAAAKWLAKKYPSPHRPFEITKRSIRIGAPSGLPGEYLEFPVWTYNN